jgi:hypothetical protein
VRQAEFVSPEMLRYHYERLSQGYVEGLQAAMDAGEIAEANAEALAWALMGMGELMGMRWILWAGRTELPEDVLAEIQRIIGCVLRVEDGAS